MANRNVNKVILIGNLTKDPEVRYTPQGTAVANFTIATNRSWTVDGVTKEAVDFHNIVSWNKLAELCGQLLNKGTMVYVEGRLQTRNWETETGERKYKTEVNIDEMIILKSKGEMGGDEGDSNYDDMEGMSDGDDLDIDDLLDEIQDEVSDED